MKINILRIILILLLLCTFFIIFGFSSQDGETSGGLSRNITNKILQLSSKYNNLEQEEKDQVSDRTEKIIRYLSSILDRKYAISSDLYRLYDYFLFQLGRLRAGRNKEILIDLKGKITEIRDTFKEADKLSS